MYSSLHVKCRLFLSNFNVPRIFPDVFSKTNFKKIKFNENPSRGSPVIGADTDGRTNTTKLTASLQQFRQRVPPPPKKERRILSANRVGSTSQHYLRHTNLMSVRLMPTYAVAQTFTSAYNFINVWIYRTSRLELSSHRDGGRGWSHALVV